jgi:hypothetical protein
MYPLVLSLHSILRWVVLILGLIAVIRALIGWLGSSQWETIDDRLGLAFTTSMDLQLLLGLLLYFVLSPLTRGAFQNFGAAMSNANLRFWAVEHFVVMIVAVILAHIGRSQSRKAEEPTAKHKRAAIFFGLALIAVLVAVPWPFLASGGGRPWIRIG